MERSFVTENSRERERLLKLVDGITDEELKLIIYKEGWTIAVALAHLAFWDQQRLALIRKWKEKGVTPESLDENFIDILNDALLPFFLAILPGKAAELAIITAEALDREIEGVSPKLIAAINALGDHHALKRSIHRKIHLDEIDALLKAKRVRK